jgi:hypothetical protein
VTSVARTTKRIGSLRHYIKHGGIGPNKGKASKKQVEAWKAQLADELALREKLKAKEAKVAAQRQSDVAPEKIMELLGGAKQLAKEYRELTGRPLGITGEVAEYEAARLLGIELSPARQAGYDAIRKTRGRTQRLQIKGRCLLPDSKPGQRVGGIRLEKEWDVVLLLDETFEATAIYEADRPAVEAALLARRLRAHEVRETLRALGCPKQSSARATSALCS